MSLTPSTKINPSFNNSRKGSEISNDSGNLNFMRSDSDDSSQGYEEENKISLKLKPCEDEGDIYNEDDVKLNLSKFKDSKMGKTHDSARTKKMNKGDRSPITPGKAMVMRTKERDGNIDILKNEHSEHKKKTKEVDKQ